MPQYATRREFCGALAAALPCVSLPCASLARAAAPPDEDPRGVALCIGNYGLGSYSTEDAVRLIAKLGFDGIEFSLMPDWDSAPEKLSADRRRMLRSLLAESRLALTSLMEDLPPSADESEHKAALTRLTQAAELGRDLSPARPPVIQTVLGGGTWDEKKHLFRDRLGDWLEIAETYELRIAVKPHRSGAMSQPSEAAWLLDQLGRPDRLGMVYDYSHYAFRDLSIEDTVHAAAPYTVLIAVKDAVLKDGNVEFALPGSAGTIDHAAILAAFYAAGYRGGVCCEVSSQVFRREGYDPLVATRACYEALDQAFETANVPRCAHEEGS